MLKLLLSAALLTTVSTVAHATSFDTKPQILRMVDVVHNSPVAASTTCSNGELGSSVTKKFDNDGNIINYTLCVSNSGVLTIDYFVAQDPTEGFSVSEDHFMINTDTVSLIDGFGQKDVNTVDEFSHSEYSRSSDASKTFIQMVKVLNVLDSHT